MRRKIVTSVLAVSMLCGVLAGCGSSGSRNKTIFDEVEIYKTTAGEVEDIWEEKNLNYKSTDYSGYTTVADSFLGFDSMQEYELVNAMDAAFPNFDDSGYDEYSRRDKVIGRIGVKLIFKSDDEAKYANAKLKKYIDDKMLKDFDEPVVEEPYENDENPVSYYPIKVVTVEGTKFYQYISWEKEYIDLEEAGLPEGYIGTIYEINLGYLSEDDLEKIKNDHNGATEDAIEASAEGTEDVSIEGAAIEEVITDNSWQSAYQSYLTTFSSEDSQEPKFNIGYIDSDDIPELFIFEGNSHYNGVRVFTYYNKSVVELGNYGESGRVQFAEKQNIIHSFRVGMGEVLDSLISIQDGVGILELDLYRYEDMDDASKNTYACADEDISREIYDTKYNEMMNGYSFIEVNYDDAYTFNDENIKSVIK